MTRLFVYNNLVESEKVYLRRWEDEAYPLLWEFSQQITEAALTQDQVLDIFQRIETVAQKSGQNRTALGRAIDLIRLPATLMDKIGELAAESRPVRQFDIVFAKTKRKLRNVIGQDSTLISVVDGMGNFAKKHPVAQGFVIGLLTLAAATVAGPVALPIVGSLLRFGNELLKGERFSTAVGRSVKTGLLGLIAAWSIPELAQLFVDTTVDFTKLPGYEQIYQWQASYNKDGELIFKINSYVPRDLKDQVDTLFDIAVKAAKEDDMARAAQAFSDLTRIIDDPEYKDAMKAALANNDVLYSKALESADAAKSVINNIVAGVQAAIAASTGSSKKTVTENSQQFKVTVTVDGKTNTVDVTAADEAAALRTAVELAKKQGLQNATVQIADVIKENSGQAMSLILNPFEITKMQSSVDADVFNNSQVKKAVIKFLLDRIQSDHPIDRLQAVHMFDELTALNCPWPELKLLKSHIDEIFDSSKTEHLCEYAANVIKDVWPRAEPRIIKDPYAAFEYAYTVRNDTWPEAEPTIMKDPEYAYLYIVNIRHNKPWPEAEPYIMKDPEYAYVYARTVLKRPWPEAEPYIKKDSWYARKYNDFVQAFNRQQFAGGFNKSKFNLKPIKEDVDQAGMLINNPFTITRIETVDPAIWQNSQLKKSIIRVMIEFIQSTGIFQRLHAAFILNGLRKQNCPWPEISVLQKHIDEIIKAATPYELYWYARDIMSQRWPQVEQKIITDPEAAYWYARYVLKRPWPEAEATIITDPEWATEYAYYVLKRPWPEAEAVITNTPYAGVYKEYFKSFPKTQLDEATVSGIMRKLANWSKNMTNRVTIDQLIKSWKKAGKPTDSDQFADFLKSLGLDHTIVDQYVPSKKAKTVKKKPSKPAASPVKINTGIPELDQQLEKLLADRGRDAVVKALKSYKAKLTAQTDSYNRYKAEMRKLSKTPGRRPLPAAAVAKFKTELQSDLDKLSKGDRDSGIYAANRIMQYARAGYDMSKEIQMWLATAGGEKKISTESQDNETPVNPEQAK